MNTLLYPKFRAQNAIASAPSRATRCHLVSRAASPFGGLAVADDADSERKARLGRMDGVAHVRAPGHDNASRRHLRYNDYVRQPAAAFAYTVVGDRSCIQTCQVIKLSGLRQGTGFRYLPDTGLCRCGRGSRRRTAALSISVEPPRPWADPPPSHTASTRSDWLSTVRPAAP